MNREYMTIKYSISDFVYNPHPQPLSQWERGEKTQNFVIPLSF
jgi:hypothetical protein